MLTGSVKMTKVTSYGLVLVITSEFLIGLLTVAKARLTLQETAIGYLPYAKDINLEGLDMTEADLERILDVDKDAWKEELKGVDELYAKFGDKLPKRLSDVLNEVKSNLDK